MEFFLRQIYPWMIYFSAGSVLIPFSAGLLLFRKQENLQFKLLLLFVSLWVTNESLSILTVYFGSTNNLWSGHLFTPIEFSVLSAIFFFSIESPLIRKLILGSVVVVGAASWYEASMPDGVTKLNSMPMMVANTFLISMTLAYFYKVANSRKMLYLEDDPIFLLSCALLIYLAGTSMSNALFNEALAISYDTARMCRAVILTLNIMFNISLVFVFRRLATC